MSSSKALCRILLIERRSDLPSSELLKTVNAEALARAETFTNDKRRADFLWGRVLLTHLVSRLSSEAHLVENPPVTPTIAGADTDYFATISHTKTWVAAAVAASPVAVDVEVMAPERARQATFERVLGEGSWQQFVASDPVSDFYKIWGLYECAVKMKGRLVTDAPYPRVDIDGSRCREAFHVLSENTLLTCVTARPTETSIEVCTIKTGQLSTRPYSSNLTA